MSKTTLAIVIVLGALLVAIGVAAHSSEEGAFSRWFAAIHGNGRAGQ